MRVSSIEFWLYQVGPTWGFYRLGRVSISGRQLALAMASTISGVLSWLLAVCDTLRWIISSKQFFVERTTLTVLQNNKLSYFWIKKDKDLGKRLFFSTCHAKLLELWFHPYNISQYVKIYFNEPLVWSGCHAWSDLWGKYITCISFMFQVVVASHNMLQALS